MFTFLMNLNNPHSEKIRAEETEEEFFTFEEKKPRQTYRNQRCFSESFS